MLKQFLNRIDKRLEESTVLKQVLRRTVRKLGLRKMVQNLRNWFQDPRDSRFAYPWLNSVFNALMRKGKGELRPHYTWGAIHGIHLAKAIGIDHVSLIEFGVAGGNGLIALEKVAEMVEREFEVGVDVYGFDSGQGLPKPTDYRDLPNIFLEGGYPIDENKLRASLKRANLILGLVRETLPAFIASKPAPVAFISFDLDLYSSTMDAFQLLKVAPNLLMPRIHCHFDDILGFTFADHNGERLAISEFNVSNRLRKISPIYGLKYCVPRSYFNASWVEQAYMVHILDHPLYNKHDGLVRHERLDLPT